MPEINRKILKARVMSSRKVAPDHFTVELGSKWLSKRSRPGQFVSVRVSENSTDPLLKIPLGIHRIEKNGIRLLYKVVGSGTRILSERKKGELLEVLGPLGNGFDLTPLTADKRTKAVLIGGGHGVAPLFALAEEAVKAGRDVDCYIGACEKKHVLCAKDFRRLGAKIHIATECGNLGHKGYVTELLEKHKKRITRRPAPVILYACGPRPMLASVAAYAKKNSIPAQVSLDAYMACGIGACQGCAVATTGGYKLVCKDGPVFDPAEILWAEESGGSCAC